MFSMKFIKKQIRNLSKFFLAVTVFILSGCLYFYSDKKTEIDVDEVLRLAGKLIVLPEGEKPTVATVTNLDPLYESPFFKNAKVGDKVIIYARSGKAILFRIDENKIVEVGPLNMKQ